MSPSNVRLLTGKRAAIILASGGDFGPGSPVEKYNQAIGYLRPVLAWIGINDVQIILAEGGAMHQVGAPLSGLDLHFVRRLR